MRQSLSCGTHTCVKRERDTASNAAKCEKQAHHVLKSGYFKARNLLSVSSGEKFNPDSTSGGYMRYIISRGYLIFLFYFTCF